MKFFKNIFLIPVLLAIASLSTKAGGSDHSSNNVHNGHSGDASPSPMILGETTFVFGGVDGVTSMGTVKDETTFNYDIKLMGMTSFIGKDMLMIAIRSGNFVMMDPFGMNGAARQDTGFNSSNNLEIHKAFYQFPLSDDVQITFGPKLRQDYLFGVWPSSYPSDPILFVLN